MRLSNTIIENKQGYAGDSLTPVIDLNKGGEFGLLTDYPAYVSAQPYIRRNMICRLLRAPGGFDYLPNPQKWREALKAFVELHVKTWEGINTKLTVETVDTPFGGDGQKIEAPSNVTRGVPEPSASTYERQGRPFFKFFEGWIVYLIMDPVTKIPRVNSLPQNQGVYIDTLPDTIGMTCVFFEPDPAFRYVEKAWLITNMYPKETPDEEGKFDKTAAGELQEFTIPFTALTQVGYGVKLLAQQMLDEYNKTGINPNTRPAFYDKVDQFVANAGTGAKEQLDAAAASAVSASA